MESRSDWDFCRQTKTAVDAPSFSAIHIIYTLHGDAKVVDGLLLADGITICSHLKVRCQSAVAETRLQSEAMIQSVLQCQRPGNRHAVVARTQDFVFTRPVGVVHGDAHDDAASLGTHCIRMIGQIDGYSGLSDLGMVQAKIVQLTAWAYN